MSHIHDLKTGKRKYEGNKESVVKSQTPKKTKQRNHYTQGKTGFVPHPCSNPVNITIAKRG